MRHVSNAMALAACVLVASAAVAETKCWGWRGDGTGQFPEADPPVTWERISETMAGLRTQAEKPAGDAPGDAKPVAFGNIPEWLILGPVNADEPPPDASVAPDVGNRLGDLAWKKVEAEAELLDLSRYVPKRAGQVVYAHAYLHSPADARVFMRIRSERCTFRLNGEEIYRSDGRKDLYADRVVTLKKGWNRLLFRVEGTIPYLMLVMWGADADGRAETSGIRWSVPLPQAGRHFSCAQPLVVGDRVIVNADPEFLVCYRKTDGKLLWVSYNGFHEAATGAERAAHPDVFAQADPAAKRLKGLAAAYDGTLAGKREMTDLVDRLGKLMEQVDPKRYRAVTARQEAGLAGLTSCSDGTHVYTWFACGVSTCHDLDGNRKWITLENEGPWTRDGVYDSDQHGFQMAPLLTPDAFIVHMKHVTALDLQTGKVLWRIPAFPAQWHKADRRAPRPSAETDAINYHSIGLYTPRVGFRTWHWATRMGDTVYMAGRDGRNNAPLFEIYRLPEKFTPGTTLERVRYRPKPWTLRETPSGFGSSFVVASPLAYDGLIYQVTTAGLLRVTDADTLDTVYERRLGLNTVFFVYPYPHGSGVCASPTLGGKYVTLWGNGGTALVIRTGRTFEVVAKNRIERVLDGYYYSTGLRFDKPGTHPECTVSSPVFEGRRIYYQAEAYLYCIGEQ